MQKPEGLRPVLLFGGNGHLGAALLRRLSDGGRRIQTIAWHDAAYWFEAPGAAAQEHAIETAIGGLVGADTDILFAGGLTDPNQPPDRLFLSNVLLPQRVIAATCAMPGCRYVSFGSILESFGGEIGANPYAASKIALGQWIRAETALKGRIVHLQIHTLYGGAAPSGHMFLGQMVDALRRRQPFAMSAGQQLREYHHVDDVAGAVERLLSALSWPQDPSLPLSSGRPVQLAALARAVFAATGRSADLRIGALPMGAAENLDRTFAAAPAWLLEPSREPIAGVCAWVETLLQGV